MPSLCMLNIWMFGVGNIWNSRILNGCFKLFCLNPAVAAVHGRHSLVRPVKVCCANFTTRMGTNEKWRKTELTNN